MGGISFVLNEDGTIKGYTSGGADTVHPFKNVPEGDFVYYYGNEIELITGGWVAYAYKPSNVSSGVNSEKPTVTKTTGFMKFYCNASSSSYKYGTLFTESKIDLSNHTKVKITVYMKSGDAKRFHVTSSKSDGFTNTKVIDITHGVNELDISSLSGSYYLAFGGGGSSVTDFIIESIELIP